MTTKDAGSWLKQNAVALVTLTLLVLGGVATYGGDRGELERLQQDIRELKSIVTADHDQITALRAEVRSRMFVRAESAPNGPTVTP